MTGTVLEQWNEYRRVMLPDVAPSSIRACRRAFLAGAMAGIKAALRVIDEEEQREAESEAHPN